MGQVSGSVWVRSGLSKIHVRFWIGFGLSSGRVWVGFVMESGQVHVLKKKTAKVKRWKKWYDQGNKNLGMVSQRSEMAEGRIKKPAYMMPV